jgi:hypothetical protein
MWVWVCVWVVNCGYILTIFNLCFFYYRSNSSEASVQWLEGMLSDNKFLDSFTFFHANAEVFFCQLLFIHLYHCIFTIIQVIIIFP